MSFVSTGNNSTIKSRGFQKPLSILLMLMVSLTGTSLFAADDLNIEKLPMAIGGWVDFGRAYKIDPTKFTDSDITSKDVVLSHTGIYLGQSATVNDRLFSILRGIERSTYGPTSTHKKLAEWIEADLIKFNTDLELIKSSMKKIYNELRDAGGPMIEGFE